MDDKIKINLEKIENTIARVLELHFDKLTAKNYGNIWKPFHDIVNILLVVLALRKYGDNEVLTSKYLSTRNTFRFYRGEGKINKKKLDDDKERIDNIVKLLQSLFDNLPEKQEGEMIFEYMERITEGIKLLTDTFDYLAADKKGGICTYIVGIAENALIKTALQKCGYNEVQTANLLGFSRNTMRKKMKRTGDKV